MSKVMPLKPRMSEKAYASSVSENTYVFIVPMDSNKQTVAGAVTEQFGVTVEDVRPMVLKGKPKRSYKKRSRPIVGQRADMKKVYVRLKDGDKINIFEQEEKEAKKAAKQTKKSKAGGKQ